MCLFSSLTGWKLSYCCVYAVLTCRIAYLYRIIIMHQPLIPSTVIYRNVVVAVLVKNKERNTCSPACTAVEGKLIVQCEVTVSPHLFESCQILHCPIVIEESVYIRRCLGALAPYSAFRLACLVM